MPEEFGLLGVVLGIFGLIILFKSIRIIHPGKKGLVERLGKFVGVKSSGMNFLIPFIESIKVVDVRERAVDVAPQSVICRDNVVVTVDCIVYLQVTDPVRAMYNIDNFVYAVVKLAQTNLRSVVGQMSLDETLSSREKMNEQLRLELDESTDAWGVKVQRVEVQQVEPPRDVVDAMHKQMRAEREKRAAILRAEGEKQAAILSAEGKKQAQILDAQGDKESQIAIAEGLAKAIELESKASTEYFNGTAITKEQLRVMEKSFANNTKFVVGSELMSAVQSAFGGGIDLGKMASAATVGATAGIVAGNRKSGNKTKTVSAHKKAVHIASTVPHGEVKV